MKLRTTIAFICIFGISPLSNANPASYAITDLGLGSTVLSIGNNNQVLATDPSGDVVIFHPTGTATDLTILVADSTICFGTAYNGEMNGSGNNNGTEIVLNVFDSNFLRAQCGMTYKNGVLTVVGTYIEGGLSGINDSGQIIGNDQPEGFGPKCDFGADGYISAIAINDSAQIVGFNHGTGSMELCTNGIWQVLPPLAGSTNSYPSAINKHGHIVGTASVNGQSHGFYTSANGITSDLGADIQLNDINVMNQSVGNHTTGSNASFMRVAGVTYDLVTLISPSDLLQPYVTFVDPSVRINDLGVIAVVGIDSRTGASHVYLLKPI